MAGHSHSFHLVDPSPWPFVASISAGLTMFGAVAYIHGYAYGNLILPFGIFMVLGTMYYWLKDVVREGTFEGFHTKVVQLGLRYGMILFIVSEVAFFFAFFWAFFDASIAPEAILGAIWPPLGIDILNPFDVPLLNTVILLVSGLAVTWGHYAIRVGFRREVIQGLIFTLGLGLSFTMLQVIEYYEANFDISDGVYGSTFYLATGFHGLHVVIGSIFLAICLVRTLEFHFTKEHHFGFEAGAWYWHFVDGVWIFLFGTIYWWGSGLYV